MKERKILICRNSSQIALLVALAVPGLAQAARLGLADQSTGMVARSYAGATVSATPSTAFYNPAGLVMLKGNQFEGAFNYYDIRSKFSGTDEPYFGQGTSSGFVESTLVPGSFGVISLPHGMKLGFSVTTPIGGRIKYRPGFVGQYQGTEALLTTIQVGLSLAIPITRTLSIGFGPEINYFQNILALDQNLGVLQPAAGQFSGKSYAFGYNAGVMYRPAPGTRIGLDYRSRISQSVKGVERIGIQLPSIVPPAVDSLLTSLGGLPPAASSASDKWTFPQQISFGVYQRLTPRLAVMASAQWTNWAQQQSLIISDPSTANFTHGAIYTPFDYRNSWTVGVGFDYRATRRLTLMGGAGYDESPVTSKYRQDLLPDANRTSLSAGMSFRLLPNATLMAGYQHIFVQNGSISQTRVGLQPNGTTQTTYSGTLDGTYSLSANVFSTGVVMSF